jgi:hypothetical protein
LVEGRVISAFQRRVAQQDHVPAERSRARNRHGAQCAAPQSGDYRQ